MGRIEIISDKKFVEYTKDGYATTFTVTAKKLLMRPFVKLYLKKQQKQYAADLQRVIEKEK